MSSPEITTAVVLVGGQGTRLRPLTNLLPKPLLPLVDIPLVAHQILWLARNGVRKVILAAGYKAQLIREMLTTPDWGVELTVVEEPKPLDTAGAIKLAADSLTEPFLATNGDVILDLPLDEMATAHRETGAVATILLRRVEKVSHYGLVLRDGHGRVTHFLEKQLHDETGQQTVNAGVYLFDPHVLDFIPDGIPWSAERQLFPDLVAHEERVYGHLPAQPYYWIDVGRLDTYRQAHRDLLSGAVRWCGGGVAEDALISASATLVQPVSIRKGARVEDGAIVGPYVTIGQGAAVRAKAQVADSILWPKAVVGRGAQVSGSIVTTGGRVPDAASICEGIVMCQ